MLTMEIDNKMVEQVFKEELQKRLDQLEERVTLWDMNELLRQTNMSVNTIKEHFFYNEDFPKYKVGIKWYFPADECTAYILNWIKGQPQS